MKQLRYLLAAICIGGGAMLAQPTPAQAAVTGDCSTWSQSAIDIFCQTHCPQGYHYIGGGWCEDINPLEVEIFCPCAPDGE